MIAYTYGTYDVLRAEDLKKLDKRIQLSREEGSEYFALGIYDDNLCEQLGFGKPLKSLDDRLKIMEQIRGIDFAFPISSLDDKIIQTKLKEQYKIFVQEKEARKQQKNNDKKYEFAYAPGTYDLFHAGHLENLKIASEQCEKLIVGIKSDELVFEHKNRNPVISAEERMEIMRHFKFVYGVYEYYTRNLNIANDWIESRFGKKADAVFLGSDLRKDFADTEGINIIYTPRSPQDMEKRSTTTYRKIYLGNEKNRRYTGNIIGKENDANKYHEEEQERE